MNDLYLIPNSTVLKNLLGITTEPSMLFNASATLIAVVLFVSIGDIVSLLYIFILSCSMDNYNKFILIPKFSKKQFIVKTTAYKNQNAVV